jgi:Hint domain
MEAHRAKATTGDLPALGNRAVSETRKLAPILGATPIIVREGAITDNVPHRDLRVTRGHSFFIDGVLIAAERLINRRSILWDDDAGPVAIYHIEMDVRDVLIANGAAAESYRNDGNREFFLLGVPMRDRSFRDARQAY